MSFIKQFELPERSNEVNGTRYIHYSNGNIYIISVIKYGSGQGNAYLGYSFQKFSMDGQLFWETRMQSGVSQTQNIKIYKSQSENTILFLLVGDYVTSSNSSVKATLATKLNDDDGKEVKVNLIYRTDTSFNDSCYINDDVICLLGNSGNTSTIEILDRQLNVISSKSLSGNAGTQTKLSTIRFIDNKLYGLGCIINGSSNKIGLIVEMNINLTSSIPAISILKNYAFQINENGSNVDFTINNIIKSDSQFLLYANNQLITKPISLSANNNTIMALKAGILLKKDADENSLIFSGESYLKVDKELNVKVSKSINLSIPFSSCATDNGLAIAFYESVPTGVSAYLRTIFFGVFNSIFESCRTRRSQLIPQYTTLNNTTVLYNTSLKDIQKASSGSFSTAFSYTKSNFFNAYCLNPQYLKLLECNIVISRSLEKGRQYSNMYVGTVDIHNCGIMMAAIPSGFVMDTSLRNSSGNSGVSFKILSGAEVPANETRRFDVVMNANPNILGNLILEIDSNDSVPFYNDEKLSVSVNVIEFVKVEIVGKDFSLMPIFELGKSYNQKIGFIELRKITGTSTTINAGSIHLLHEKLNGLQFSINNVNLSDSNVKKADVYVMGQVDGTTSISEPININFVDNPNNNYKIDFNVIPVLQILSDVYANVTLGETYSKQHISTFEIKNLSNTTVNFNDVSIHSSPLIAGGLKFTASYNSAQNIQSGATLLIDVFVSGTATQPLNDYWELITLKVVGFTVKNDNLYKLKLNIIDESFKVEILNDLVVNGDFIKDLPLVESKTVGFLEMRNKTITKPFLIGAGTVIHDTTVSYGLRFQVKNNVELPSNQSQGQSTLVEVVALSDFGASQLGNGLNVPVEIPSVTSNSHRIIFNVAEDILDVEIMDNVGISYIFEQEKPLDIDILDVGTLKLKSNAKVKKLYIPKDTLIHSSPDINGIEFRTQEEITLNAGEDKTVKVYVAKGGKAIIYGPQSFPVSLPINSVHNPNNYKIVFNVKQESIKASIKGAPASEIFIKGLPPNLYRSFGNISIYNETKTRALDISPRDLFTSNGFTFSIPEKTDGTAYNIPSLSTGNIPVWVRATNTMDSVAGCNDWVIAIESVLNNPQYRISFCVEDEPLDVRITRYTPEPGGNIFIQGLSTGRTFFPGGKVEITNFTETRNFSLFGRYFIGGINGLNFYLNAGKTTIGANGGKVELSIIVKSDLGALSLGDWQLALDLLFLGITPNTFDIPFKVIEDMLNVELTHAEFYLQGLKKGEQVPGSLNKRVGRITIKNKSFVKAFRLQPHTPIHWEESLNGLVFQTSNSKELIINRDDAPVAIDIELKPGNITPAELGNYQYNIFIKDVKNPGDSNPEAFFIELNVFGNGTNVGTNEATSLQSPHFSLMTAGSRGTDSPRGNQLRWIFSGNLGEKHIPKGTLESNRYHYNKPNDFVNVYRAPYIEKLSTKFTLDLSKSPSLTDNEQRCWIYKINSVSTEEDIPAKFPTNQRTLYVYFRNKNLYDTLILSKDPYGDPQGFIFSYGENIIEIESKDDFFFKVSLPTNKFNSGDIYMEVLSAEENKLIASKYLSFRSKITPRDLRSNRIFAENGRSLRFKKQGSPLFVFEFEFYSDFIASASYWNAWELMGNCGLTTDAEILNRQLGDIHGKWLRYNNKDFVNKQNYIDKWNFRSTETTDLRMGIKEVVDKYVLKSSKRNNPRAEDYIGFNFSAPDSSYISDVPTDENEGSLVSYLDMLNIAAVDYHVARMLGLGILDLSQEVISGKEYIYMTEYKTLKDPNDENTTLIQPCQLLAVSLPTSITTQRLPLPIEIADLYKGVPKIQNGDTPDLYDEEGYTFDGKTRIISIRSKPVPLAERNPSFFPNEVYWDASLYTLPVYAGLEYRVASRVIGPGSPGQTPDMNVAPVQPSDPATLWRKPELSHDIHYKNVDNNGNVTVFETVPIMIPETFDEALYVHRQMTSGDYYYATYGINIFSRSTASKLSLNISTYIKPKNTLLPPSDIKTWLIQPEKPLMFTSESEQEKYAELVQNKVEDKTFIRINFSYDAAQDIVTHPLDLDSGVRDEDYINDPSYFPDDYDVFADEIEVYFRKETPRKISAGLYKVEADNDRLCVIFRTKSYKVVSTGENLISVFPEDTTFRNFIGSVFLVNNKSYVIKNISSDVLGLVFTVYKEEVSRTILAGGSIAVDFSTLSTPQTSGNDLFVVMENMQSQDVWGNNNPIAFKVPIEFPVIHREIIAKSSEGGSVQKYLEKSRGLWIDASVEEFKENGVHRGLYKVTIPDIGLGIPLDVSENAFYEKNHGSLRAFRNRNVSDDVFNDSRDVFKVLSTESYGRYANLYIYDSEFKFDANGNPSGNSAKNAIQTGIVKINYYPAYSLYLYKDDKSGINQDTVLPTGDNVIKYSIFGLRSVDRDFNINGEVYRSKFSAPNLMMGQKIVSPRQPQPPKGSQYATRPDFYGKATYSFTTKFTQRPYGVQFCRTDNNALLNALYEQNTIKEILNNLEIFGGNDEDYLAERWQNFFDYVSLGSEGGSGTYGFYPEPTRSITENTESISENNVRKEMSDGSGLEELIKIGYAFPLPDKIGFFNEINKFIELHNFNTGQSVKPVKSDGSVKLNDIIISQVEGVNRTFRMIDFVEEVIENSFVPLTEVPVIYQHVKKAEGDSPYFPINKKQTIRDKDGYLIRPDNTDFDMAPMMTVLDEKENVILFTDFTLTGTTSNLYFYASREIGSQMTAGVLSSPLGPIKTIDSNPPEAPKVLSGLPVLENRVLGITPKIKIEVHSYKKFQKIERINLYRCDNRADATSILSMQLVKQMNISDIVPSETGAWVITDELEGYEYIPYGQTLYYRVTVDKTIKYANPQLNNDGTQSIISDFAPSHASKILAFMLTENYQPTSPPLEGTAVRPKDDDSVNNVILYWDVTCYKGIYHLYSMSVQGNWKEIARLTTNGTNDMVQLQVYNAIASNPQDTWLDVKMLDIIDSKITLNLGLLGSSYNQFPLFDEDNNRKYYHFKVIAENTSGMFSTEDNILTLFSNQVWDNLSGISFDGKEGMIIGKTFIIT